VWAQAALPPNVQLVWSAPAECPNRERAEQILASLVSATNAEPHMAAIAITRQGSSYDASIVFSGALHGERRVQAPSCHTLADAALLIVAVTIDPLQAAVHVVHNHEPPAAPERIDVHLDARIGVDIGSLPEVTFGPGVEVGVTLGRMRLGLEATYWVPQLQLLSDGSGGLIRLVEAGVRGCLDRLRTPSYRLGPCAALTAGISAGEGYELDRNESSLAPWAAARLGASFRQQSEPLFVELSLDAGRAFVSPSYTIDGEEVFHAVWFGRVCLSVGLIW
jgi:hypothetical protein